MSGITTVSDNRYAVIFTGQLKPDATTQVVVSNLVLDMGLPQEKVVRLLKMGQVVLKRCATMPEAQRLAEKFDRAGAVCIIEDRLARESAVAQSSVSGESSLVRFLSKFIPSSRQGRVVATPKR
jgi:hypothetical protein